MSKASDPLPEADDFCVCVRFFGAELEPDEITRLLGSAPTESERRGDLIPSRTRPRTAEQGSWRFALPTSSADLEQQLAELFSHLTPDVTIWQSLTARFEADVFCGAFFKRQSGGFHFSPHLHRLLADRNLTLAIDIYTSDPSDDSSS